MGAFGLSLGCHLSREVGTGGADAGDSQGEGQLKGSQKEGPDCVLGPAGSSEDETQDGGRRRRGWGGGGGRQWMRPEGQPGA